MSLRVWIENNGARDRIVVSQPGYDASDPALPLARRIFDSNYLNRVSITYDQVHSVAPNGGSISAYTVDVQDQTNAGILATVYLDSGNLPVSGPYTSWTGKSLNWSAGRAVFNFHYWNRNEFQNRTIIGWAGLYIGQAGPSAPPAGYSRYHLLNAYGGTVKFRLTQHTGIVSASGFAGA